MPGRGDERSARVALTHDRTSVRRRRGDREDVGYFGPESITWRVHADPVLLVGGLRALFLQALYPPAMAAVASHSNFRQQPWQRLLRTANYIGVTTYGTVAEADAAVAGVREIHAAVPGTDDIDRLRWIHCCEIDSFLTTTRRAGLPLDARDADRYVAEQVRSATFVGLAERDVPHDTSDLSRYFERMRPLLAVTPHTREAARYLFLPPMPTWVRFFTPARPGWAGMVTLGFALLPAWARRMYRMPGLVTTDVAASAAARAMRTSLLLLPSRVRTGPHVKAARERLMADLAAS